jgi:hypothetical protein
VFLLNGPTPFADPVIDVRQRAFSVLAGCMRIAPVAFIQDVAARVPSPAKNKKKLVTNDATVL